MTILYNPYVILVLRVLHVAGGVLWVGAAVFYLFLLIPAVRSSESAGQKFMQNLGPRLGMFMRVVTTVTILSGGLLYARYFAGGIDWMWKTDAGLCFTIGALAALVSYGIGIAVIGPNQEKVQALGEAMASAGEPPRPEQIAQMQSLDARLLQTYRIDFAMLAVSVVAMAAARYL